MVGYENGWIRLVKKSALGEKPNENKHTRRNGKWHKHDLDLNFKKNFRSLTYFLESTKWYTKKTSHATVPLKYFLLTSSSRVRKPTGMSATAMTPCTGVVSLFCTCIFPTRNLHSMQQAEFSTKSLKQLARILRNGVHVQPSRPCSRMKIIHTELSRILHTPCRLQIWFK